MSLSTATKGVPGTAEGAVAWGEICQEREREAGGPFGRELRSAREVENVAAARRQDEEQQDEAGPPQAHPEAGRACHPVGRCCRGS